jgi:hypothetical protein
MIVRISGEDQYRLEDSEIDRVNELENAVVAIVNGEAQDGYEAAFAELLDYVRSHGTVVGDEELEGSSIILPPADLSFAEARKEFTGEGLIPD